MPKEFESILKKTGPYYLTAVDKVKPYIDQLPCELTAFDKMDEDLGSRDSVLYNDIEDYKGKRAKGALLAIYQYVDELKKLSIANGLPGQEVLNELQAQFKLLLISSTKELLGSLKSVMASLKSTFEKWEKIVSYEHDKDKVIRIYQTAYLTFRMLHLKTGETMIKIMPGVGGLREKLVEMMGVLRGAADELIQLVETAEAQRIEEERLAHEAREKAEEAQKGLFAELEGAVRRAKRIVADKIEEEKRRFSPKMPQIELLICLIKTLNRNDELNTFWSVFRRKFWFKQLLELCQISGDKHDAWMSTFDYQTGNGILSYFSSATIDQDILEKEAVAATNRVLNIFIEGKYNALANLLRTQREYEKGAMFEYLTASDTLLSSIETKIKALPREIQLLSPLPSWSNYNQLTLSEQTDEIEEDTIVLFERIMKEMNTVRNQLQKQSLQLGACLKSVFALKKLIQEELKENYSNELEEKFPRVVEEIFAKVFGEKPDTEMPMETVLLTLSTSYPQIISGIDNAIEQYQLRAVELNNTVADNKLAVLNQFISSTTKKPWHWLFYWFSPTYHRCFDQIKDVLGSEQDLKPAPKTQLETITGMLETSKEKLWRYSPTGSLVSSLSRRTGESIFFSIEQCEASREDHLYDTAPLLNGR